MKKPTLISALAIAAALALPGAASAASFRDLNDQAGGKTQRTHQRGDDHRRGDGERRGHERQRDHRNPGHGYWAPSRYRHDHGRHYGHYYGHRYHYRPLPHYRPYYGDDVRLRIYYDLHL